MSRVYREPVEVQAREDGRPTRFVWRGRLYTVRSILEHWAVNREWWREANPADPAPGGSSPGEIAGQPELEYWRVEASAGRGFPAGTYELCRDVAADAWALRRVVD
jgi:uncharacterized protein DUF6504